MKLISLIFILFPFIAQAQVERMELSSGTGFYINSQGYVLTNAHVVPDCKRIAVHGGATEPVAARVVAKDEKLDLAVLKVESRPPAVASLRDMTIPPTVGEGLMLAGFPGNSGAEGVITLKLAQLLSDKGPTGQTEWLQFTEAAAHGNSGGPLLDAFGNVLGVVVGKSKLITYNQSTGQQLSEKDSDVAISLSAVMRFLQQYGIPFATTRNNNELPAQLIANQAGKYIVNVLCRVN